MNHFFFSYQVPLKYNPANVLMLFIFQDNWIVRPYLAFEGKLESSLQHPVPAFELPPDLEHTLFPLPSVVFRIFDTQVCCLTTSLYPSSSVSLSLSLFISPSLYLLSLSFAPLYLFVSISPVHICLSDVSCCI